MMQMRKLDLCVRFVLAFVAIILLWSSVGCLEHRTRSVPSGFSYPQLGFTVEEKQQTTQEVLAGRIVDSTGVPVGSALVEVYDPLTKTRIDAQFSTNSGRFHFRKIPQGHLDLRVTKPGFSRSVTPLDVQNGKRVSRLTIELHLAV